MSDCKNNARPNGVMENIFYLMGHSKLQYIIKPSWAMVLIGRVTSCPLVGWLGLLVHSVIHL